MARGTAAGAGEMRARLRGKAGSSADLAVLDLSAGGCMVHAGGWSARPGERVLTTLPGLAAQPGELVWLEDDRAGIAFEQPLHEAVLDNLQARLRG